MNTITKKSTFSTEPQTIEGLQLVPYECKGRNRDHLGIRTFELPYPWSEGKRYKDMPNIEHLRVNENGELLTYSLPDGSTFLLGERSTPSMKGTTPNEAGKALNVLRVDPESGKLKTVGSIQFIFNGDKLGEPVQPVRHTIGDTTYFLGSQVRRKSIDPDTPAYVHAYIWDGTSFFGNRDESVANFLPVGDDGAPIIASIEELRSLAGKRIRVGTGHAHSSGGPDA